MAIHSRIVTSATGSGRGHGNLVSEPSIPWSHGSRQGAPAELPLRPPISAREERLRSLEAMEPPPLPSPPAPDYGYPPEMTTPFPAQYTAQSPLSTWNHQPSPYSPPPALDPFGYPPSEPYDHSSPFSVPYDYYDYYQQQYSILPPQSYSPPLPQYTNQSVPSLWYHQSQQQHPSIPYFLVEPSPTLQQQYETLPSLPQSQQPPYQSLQQQEQSEPEVFDEVHVRKLGSMSWCRRCKIDCTTMEGLALHSLTSEHQNRTMALVLSIKQNIQSTTSCGSTGEKMASYSSGSITGPVSKRGTRTTDMISSISNQVEDVEISSDSIPDTSVAKAVKEVEKHLEDEETENVDYSVPTLREQEVLHFSGSASNPQPLQELDTKVHDLNSNNSCGVSIATVISRAKLDLYGLDTEVPEVHGTNEEVDANVDVISGKKGSVRSDVSIGAAILKANSILFHGWPLKPIEPSPIDSILSTELTNKDLLYAKQLNLKILYGTWNLGQERASHDSLTRWLVSAAIEVGLVVVGLQEVDMSVGSLVLFAVGMVWDPGVKETVTIDVTNPKGKKYLIVKRK